VNLSDVIKKRRSVRRYTPDPINSEIVKKCVEAARLAPSACNSQPWTFIVVDDEKLKNELASRAFSGVYGINGFAAKAPVLIVVVRESENYLSKLGGYLKDVKYALIDIGIACEHLVLQAEEEGIGTCYIGWFNEKETKKLLGIPRSRKVDLIISMGYTDNTGHKEKIRKPASEVMKFNGYG